MGVAIIVGIVVALVLTCLVVLHIPPTTWFGKFLTHPKSADLFAQIAQSVGISRASVYRAFAEAKEAEGA